MYNESTSFHVSTKDTKSYPGKKIEGKKPQLLCDHCKRINHTIDKCYKFHGYPNSSKMGARSGNFIIANQAWVEHEKGDTQDEPHLSLPGLS